MMRSGHKYLFLFFVVVTCMALAVPARAAFTTTKRLYIDGAFVGSNTVVGLTYSYERITLASEGNRWSMYNCLSGMLDEFSIYPGVLDANAVSDHYDAAGVGESNYVAEVRSDNPLIYLRMDDPNSLDGSPAVCDPCSSVDRDGTYIGVVAQAAGLFGTGAVFPGDVPDANDRGCIDVWDGDEAYSLEDISIEVWVKSVHLDDNYPRLFQHNGDWLVETAYGASTDANDGGVMQVGVIGGNDTSYFATPVDINDGDWHQVVVTYETTFEPVGYATEVAADNPAVWFRFEQDDIAHDVNVVNSGSISNLPAKYIGTVVQPRYAPGKIGKGVFFDNQAQNAVVITSPKYEDGGADFSHNYALVPGDMTIEVWFRSGYGSEYYDAGTNFNLDYPRLFANNNGTQGFGAPRVYFMAGQYGIGCAIEQDADVQYGNYMWPFHPGFDPNADPNHNTGPADYVWHHAVMTMDTNDTDGGDPNTDPPLTAEFYLDGALLSSKVYDPALDPNSSGILGPEFREFLIGAEGNSGNRYNDFYGTFDEFAIYSKVLTADRIVVHYQEGLAAASWTPGTCAEIFEQGWNKPADLNGDCRVNFKDMVDMGNDWWRCNHPDDNTCEKPWL